VSRDLRSGAHERTPVGRAAHALRRAARAGSYLLAVSAAVLVLAAAVGQGFGWWRFLPVLSGSMEPAIGTHSMVLVAPATADSVQTGDVIVYHIPIDDHRPVVHRVVEVVEAGSSPVVRTKGDANNGADPWTARLEGGTIWRVAAVVPHAGAPFAWLQDPGVRFAVLASAAVLVLALALHMLWRRPPKPYVPLHAK